MSKPLDKVYDPPLKNCKDCLDEFGHCQRPAPHPGPRCRTHALARRNAARRSNHQTYVERTYSLPPGGYDALKEFQGGKCAICKRNTGKTKNLSVDHDHRHCDQCAGNTSCGNGVRGLLCGPCNMMIGRILRDNPQLALAAYEYLTDPPYRRMQRQALPEGTIPVKIEKYEDWATLRQEIENQLVGGMERKDYEQAKAEGMSHRLLYAMYPGPFTDDVQAGRIEPEPVSPEEQRAMIDHVSESYERRERGEGDPL